MYQLMPWVVNACHRNETLLGAISLKPYRFSPVFLDWLPLELPTERDCKVAAQRCGASEWRDLYMAAPARRSDLDDPPAKPRKFWLVWCENQAGDRVPTYQHWSQQAARSEAVRLARLRPGERFWVLCAESACEVGEVEWVDADPEGEFPYDDIPF